MSNKEMPKSYEPGFYEDELYAAWSKGGYFQPDPQKEESYTIMMPPPNVTGVLHLGHALENALMDTMARYQRLRGKKVLLVPGTDHAALPTQAKVEKMLMDGGMKNPRQELGREALVEKIRVFAEESRATILAQIKKMGTSCDWTRLAYTFDEPRNKAVNELFSRMYHDGLIYRGARVVNWSTIGQSTCSDDEIEYVDRKSVLYTFKYSADFPIVIATTRPETKLGDTAVAVHPSDERYQKYIGQTFVVDVGAEKPREIKIIADEQVDPAYGTGALGVTPAHSPVDFLMYEKQKAAGDPIELIQVIGTDGRMTKEAGTYAGLTVLEAREKFVAWLDAQGLMQAEPQEIEQNVGTHSRYHDVIESLPMTQWWLDVQKEIPGRGKSLRDLMAEALTTGLEGNPEQKVVINPERFTKLYLHRVEHLRDWCLSRQTWWGHRIPVWYKGEEIFVGNEAPEGDGWEQDPDTLDTWFSSGSWTFSTLGWPDKTADMNSFHPTNWIQMGYEILYLWLMRMVLMSTYALEVVPFKDAYIHGMLRNESGKKFSKSDANGIDPLEIIQQYGCDALRISVLSGNTPGNDSRYSDEKVASSRNFVNKLWNISRFIFLSSEGVSVEAEALPKTLADRWILGRLTQVKETIETLIEQYDFSLAIDVLREFVWNDFADWYLEIAKGQQKNEELAESTKQNLLFVLRNILMIAHPFMPFVTEAIWQEGKMKGYLIAQSWPDVSHALSEQDAQDFSFVREVIVSIRHARTEQKIEPKKLMQVVLVAEGASADVLHSMRELIVLLARTEPTLSVQPYYDVAATDMVFAVKDIKIIIQLADLLDPAVEQARIAKERKELSAYIELIAQKLQNQGFREKAPQHIVEELETKLREAQQKLEALSL